MKQPLPFPPLQTLAITNLRHPLGLPVQDISYKWDRATCGLLRLATFTERDGFKGHHVVASVTALFLARIPTHTLVSSTAEQGARAQQKPGWTELRRREFS